MDFLNGDSVDGAGDAPVNTERLVGYAFPFRGPASRRAYPDADKRESGYNVICGVAKI